jgi:hypothetical protein
MGDKKVFVKGLCIVISVVIIIELIARVLYYLMVTVTGPTPITHALFISIVFILYFLCRPISTIPIFFEDHLNDFTQYSPSITLRCFDLIFWIGLSVLIVFIVFRIHLSQDKGAI